MTRAVSNYVTINRRESQTCLFLFENSAGKKTGCYRIMNITLHEKETWLFSKIGSIRVDQKLNFNLYTRSIIPAHSYKVS